MAETHQEVKPALDTPAEVAGEKNAVSSSSMSLGDEKEITYMTGVRFYLVLAA